MKHYFLNILVIILLLGTFPFSVGANEDVESSLVEVSAIYNKADSTLEIRGKDLGIGRELMVDVENPPYIEKIKPFSFSNTTTVENDGSFYVKTEVLPKVSRYFVVIFDSNGVGRNLEVIADPVYLDVEKRNESRKKEDIKSMWMKYQPRYSGTKYVQVPHIMAPYKAGVLQPKFLQDGVNMTNFVRYISGLSTTVELDKSLLESAQYKSVLTEVAFDENNPHSPKKPKDMTNDFFEKSYGSWENLIVGFTPSLDSAVEDFMGDGGNYARVGHRSAILSPYMERVGFGMVGNTTIMHMDNKPESNLVANFKTIGWPSKGYFPIKYADCVWSVNLNTDEYEELKASQMRIEMTNVAMKKTWVLTTQSKNGYLNVNPNLLTFRPDDLSYRPGDTIRVTIKGARTIKGKSTVISYDVKLFNLDEITVNVNGKELNLLAEPIEKYKVIYVDAEVLKSLGLNAAWDNKTKTYKISKDNKSIILKYGTSYAFVNNKKITLKNPVHIEGRTPYVPFQFVTNTFGIKNKYDAKLKIIRVEK